MSVGDQICRDWVISDEEYKLLEDSFGLLCEFQAHDLIRRNTRCNHIDEQCDIAQNLRIAMMRAGSYYKRQIYIESCLKLCIIYVKDAFTKSLIDSLQESWNNKTKHGSNKQRFGPEQELLLSQLTKKIVPKKYRPNRDEPLKIDKKFPAYCKSITWNMTKTMGKAISRAKDIRANMVSLSEYEYLSNNI